ncbi:PAS and ANTAR domain-containing protein [Nocardia arizonensis]|uniref:PAS and ANTAR domain-containing protein n=1 Tax=Nocardia arizonensis TaxID=1141647 RepID=UPI0006D26C34|nr:PAS and ANTAR domain-containing protein [Nocardia arizonensis]
MFDYEATNPAAKGGFSRRTGKFWFWFADQRWQWSDEVAALHGYAPGQVEPTTRLLLTHKHPDDRAEVADTLSRVVETGLPFSSRHRIIDTSGATRHVLVVGDQLHDPDGALVGTTGYYIDVTDTIAAEQAIVVDEQLPELVAARAAIEQAKGALMLAYGIGADQAFSLLVWRSQDTNVRVRVLAEKLVAALSHLEGATAQVRTRFDHLLLTVHE